MTQKLFDTMTDKVDFTSRAKLSRVKIKGLVSRELPIETKGINQMV